MKTFTPDQVAFHNREDDCWIIVDGKVLDVTKFLNEHPGGKKLLFSKAGQDATKEFRAFHSQSVFAKFLPQLQIGSISTSDQESHQQQQMMIATTGDELSPSQQQQQTFGELVPYGDPTWYQGWNSPYFNETHIRFRAAVREFVDREILPFVHEWDEKKSIPREVFVKAYEAGWLPSVIGPPWPVEYVGSKIAGGIRPQQFDAFHEMILIDEFARCGSGGVLWGLFEGISIGLPPVMLFGSKYLREKVVRDCLTGKKVICLAVTEPSAGSDVASITTRAVLSPDRKHYIVNGEKKFITNGIFSDYFTVAVRTGPPESGMKGLSFLLIEKNTPGVKTRAMNMQGVWASGTTYITFEDARVPVENLIGQENNGFKYIMYNFNHERWGIVVQTNRFSRVCYEEAFKYAHKRMTFGKRLIDHPVIRLKLANMARQIEAIQSWLEIVTYQLKTMPHEEAMRKLGGPIALLKVQATTTFEFCAREASQIFGGLAYTRGSQADKVERLYREVRAYAIGGGSEEVLLDLGARRASQQWQTVQSKM